MKIYRNEYRSSYGKHGFSYHSSRVKAKTAKAEYFTVMKETHGGTDVKPEVLETTIEVEISGKGIIAALSKYASIVGEE